MRKISRPRRLGVKIAVASALAVVPMAAVAAPAFAATVPGTVQADQNWQGNQNQPGQNWQNNRGHRDDHRGGNGQWQGPQNNGPAQWGQNNQGAPWQNNQAAPWQNLLPPNLQQPSTANPLSGLFGSS